MTLTRSLEPAAAIRRIDSDREDLLAVDISGDVTGADVENLYGLLEGAYAVHSHVDVLVRCTDIATIDWDSVSQETLAQGRDRAQTHVRRCAAVGGPDWTERAITSLGEGSAPELRYFAADREADAWAWLGAQPA